MTIQEWGAIGEAIGGFAIIISLVYVGVQIRQNTNAMKAATGQAFIDSHGALAFQFISPGFRDVFWRGLSGQSNLENGELASFGGWCLQVFRLWEIYHYQWKSGLFEGDIWRGWETQLRDLLSYPGVRESWAIRRHQFSDEFRCMVDGLVETAVPMAIYGEDRSTQGVDASA